MDEISLHFFALFHPTTMIKALKPHQRYAVRKLGYNMTSVNWLALLKYRVWAPLKLRQQNIGNSLAKFLVN